MHRQGQGWLGGLQDVDDSWQELFFYSDSVWSLYVEFSQGLIHLSGAADNYVCVTSLSAGSVWCLFITCFNVRDSLGSVSPSIWLIRCPNRARLLLGFPISAWFEMDGGYTYFCLEIPAPSIIMLRTYNGSVTSRVPEFGVGRCRPAGDDEKRSLDLLQGIIICWRKSVQIATERICIAA